MWIVVESGDLEGKAFELSAPRFTVGRDPSADLTLDDSQVSGRHLQFTRGEDGGVVVEDLGSTNGTIVDGRRLDGPVALHGGERMRIGRTVVSVAMARPGESTPDSTVVAPARGGGAPAAAAAAAGAAAGAAAAAAPPAEAAPPLVTPIPRAQSPGAAPGAAPPPGAAAPPPGDAGAPPPGGRSPAPVVPRAGTPSAIERVKLRRSANTAIAIAVGAVVVAVVAVVLAVTGVFDSGSSTPTVAQVVAKVAPSTLLVVASQGGQPAEKGTAWVLDGKHGLIVTNNHVAQGGDSLSVGTGGTPTGTVAMSAHGATIVGAAPCEDIAVLKVPDARNLESVPIAPQSQLQTGDQVVALGFPVNASLDDNLIATSGIVSVPRTQLSASEVGLAEGPSLTDAVQTTAAINPGNSGGPLVNYQGQLVGMNSAVLNSSGGNPVQGQGYAIGSDRVRQITAKLRTGHSIGWAGFGFTFPAPSQLQARGLPPGLVVAYTEPGSPASKLAAFQQGPVLITAINGHPLDTTLTSYCNAVKGIDGQTATVDGILLSSGQSGTVQVPFE
jgi:S1-C subfamily serine protease